MIITAKSTPDIEIDDKINRGFNNIEIQLVKERIDNNDYFDSISRGANIVSVHTPLLDKIDVEVNHIFNETYYNMFYDTCIIAQKYAEYYKHDIIVILHNGLSRSNWIDNYILIEKLAKMFKEIINIFPNLKFAIENTTPYSNSIASEGTEVEDAAYVAKQMNKILNTNKFGVVIDICHLMMTRRYKKACLGDYPELLNLKSFEDSFKESNGLLFVMHLNNCANMGCKNDHGIPFDESNEEDMKVLQDVITQYLKYGNNAIISLEVREDDYFNCVNVVKTYKALEKTLNKLGYNGIIDK